MRFSYRLSLHHCKSSLAGTELSPTLVFSNAISSFGLLAYLLEALLEAHTKVVMASLMLTLVKLASMLG
jgi:hypothetical protein